MAVLGRNVVQAYTPGTTGSTSPFLSLTTSDDPYALAIGTDGTFYVGYDDSRDYNISVYPPGSTSLTSPERKIALSANPSWLAVDASGDIYAIVDTGTGTNQVFEYAPAQATATRSFGASAMSRGLAIDAAGSVYTSDTPVYVFGSNASGTNATPSRTITNSAGSQSNLTIDPNGTLVTTNGTSVYVLGNAETLSGTVNPIRSFSDSSLSPTDIAVDASGNSYVTDYTNGKIDIYSASASGAVSSARTFTATRPAGIAIVP